MIKIAVCDDEKNIRSYLISLIREQNAECEITEYASAEEYLLDDTEHDLLFLDIELDGSVSGMDGIGLARQIRKSERLKQPVIIFVTGHERYVYDAFDVDAFQYLLKPVNEQRFIEIFGRALDKILSETEQRKKTLVIRHGGASKVISLDNIYYMESQGHKIMLYTKEGKTEYYARIGELEEELRGQFCRIHKGYLVNLACVDEYGKTEILLTNGDRLPLSKYKYEDFVKTYLQFMQ